MFWTVRHALLLVAAAAGAVASLEGMARLPRAPATAGQNLATASLALSARGNAAQAALATRSVADDMTRALQRELRRVGCYAGELNGVWGPATITALTDFADRLQMRLPPSHDDLLLLQLVQAETRVVCARRADQPRRAEPAQRAQQASLETNAAAIRVPEPRLVSAPVEVKRPTAKRGGTPADQDSVRPSKEAIYAEPEAQPQRERAPSQRGQRGQRSETQPQQPTFLGSLMQGISGTLGSLTP